MSCQAITASQFGSIIQDNDIVFVDFWAAWCSPCKQFSQIYEKVSEEFFDITFTTVNIEEEKDLASLFEIRSIPHLMVFKQGIVVYSEAGSILESTLTELAQQARDVDVSAIKEQQFA